MNNQATNMRKGRGGIQGIFKVKGKFFLFLTQPEMVIMTMRMMMMIK